MVLGIEYSGFEKTFGFVLRKKFGYHPGYYPVAENRKKKLFWWLLHGAQSEIVILIEYGTRMDLKRLLDLLCEKKVANLGTNLLPKITKNMF